MSASSRIGQAYRAARAVRRNARTARRVTREILTSGELDPKLVHQFLDYSPDSMLQSAATKLAAMTTWIGAVVAVVVGLLFAAYPEIPFGIREATPGLRLNIRLHDAFNYVHGIHFGEVTEQHLIDHVPDLGFDLALLAPLYGLLVWGFVHFGWRRRLLSLGGVARELVENGSLPARAPVTLRWKMRFGYTGLMVGDGDPLADEFVRSRAADEVLILATRRQEVSDIWVRVTDDAGLDDLIKAFDLASFDRCGRLILMPVQEQHAVFPPADAYDISPERLEDLLCNIRALEDRLESPPPGGPRRIPIIVVGDREQATVIHSFDEAGREAVAGLSTAITLETIAAKLGESLIIIDPTDVVLRRVIEMAAGGRIDFRGTEESRAMYEVQFRRRLQELGHRVTDPGRVFHMGYNITDDPTVADSMNTAAVILTASARDALLHKGYPSDRILYVPDLVIREITSLGARVGLA